MARLGVMKVQQVSNPQWNCLGLSSRGNQVCSQMHTLGLSKRWAVSSAQKQAVWGRARTGVSIHVCRCKGCSAISTTAHASRMGSRGRKVWGRARPGHRPWVPGARQVTRQQPRQVRWGTSGVHVRLSVTSGLLKVAGTTRRTVLSPVAWGFNKGLQRFACTVHGQPCPKVWAPKHLCKSKVHPAACNGFQVNETVGHKVGNQVRKPASPTGSTRLSCPGWAHGRSLKIEAQQGHRGSKCRLVSK